MRYSCCDHLRLRAVAEGGTLNAIQYVEVSDSEAPSEELRQRTLFLRLLAPAPALGATNVRIDGGERIPVGVSWVVPASGPLPPGEDPALVAGIAEPDAVLVVRTSSRGDFSTYTLRLVAGPGSSDPPAGFDPLLAAVDLSFKVECPSDFDCAAVVPCPPEPTTSPAIDYLAKDYGSFRRLMLDRMSVLAPDWEERSPADVGVTIVEVLAYLGDELSYRQDAVATEAYLATARRRPSLRRHARLVDHLVHEGSNARTWARLRVDPDAVAVPVPARTALLTRVAGLGTRVADGSEQLRTALAAGAETFETVEPAVLYGDHQRFTFWAWGDRGCCLPVGATGATLVGLHPALKAGDVLVLAEVASPSTGSRSDADPGRRHAVRLTQVTNGMDPSGGRFSIPPDDQALEVTELVWDSEDALPFPVCVSDDRHPGLVISEAWGNIVLADHGRTISGEDLGMVPASVATYASRPSGVGCDHPAPVPVPARYRPQLARPGVTHAAPPPSTEAGSGPASAAVRAALAVATVGPVLRSWLDDRGVRIPAGTGVVRGDHGTWSVSDGTTVAIVHHDVGLDTLTVWHRPPSATATTTADPRKAAPAIVLAGELDGSIERWTSRRDLLASGSGAPEYVAEVEHDGTAVLRFGDGTSGRRPATGTRFRADYRVGNGPAGNIGADGLFHVVTTDASILGVGNPLPATGGTAPETPEAIRRDAPQGFLVQQRAVTADDYARAAEHQREVQQAAATFRWTGSWHTVFVTADRLGGSAVDEPLELDIRDQLEPLRMAGYDLEVDAPHLVSLAVELHLCVEPDHFRPDVRAAVLDVLSSSRRSDGSLGFFHPDRFTFAQPVFASAIVAAAQAVPGVESVQLVRFERQHDPASSGLEDGVLPMARLEIARLDNDRSFPERGTLVVTAGGGR